MEAPEDFKPSKNSDDKKVSCKPSKKKHPRPRKTNSYVCDTRSAQELKIEANKRGQIRICSQLGKKAATNLERRVKVLIASEDLKKRLLVKSKTKK